MTDNNLSQDFTKTDVVLKKGELQPEYIKTIRTAATEGIVMLENNGVLPLAAGTKVSVFGRVQHDYFYVGYGSGGDVKKPYAVSLMEGLFANPHFDVNKDLSDTYQNWCDINVPDHGGWGTWPTNFEEMPLSDQLVKDAAALSEVAIVVIGRSAGEDRESLLAPGSFYLTTAEKLMLNVVTDNFSKVVVIIDAGNAMDMAWAKTYGDKISALMYAWQGGMESGNAIADVLSGFVSPSGKLTSTIAHKYEDYPSAGNFGGEVYNNYVEDIFVGYRYFETFAKDAVLYPFGYGLSYTTFSTELAGEITDINWKITIPVKVTNTGTTSGKHVVQIYYSAPQGVLGKPAVELAGFAKTAVLEPGATEILNITYNKSLMASYDDTNDTNCKSAWVYEAGDYIISIGDSSRAVEPVGKITVEVLEIVEQLTEAAAIEYGKAFKRLLAKQDAAGNIVQFWDWAPARKVDLRTRILEGMPTEFANPGRAIHFADVIAGTATLEDFVASLTIEELEGLTRGDYIMNSPLGAPGNAGVFGGVTEALRAKGVKPITTCDGPSGVRLQYEAALLPVGMALASTWNLPLLLELATFQGEELRSKGSNVLLAPGMNIMRDPLCGRNFEYFSEDPILTGLVASEMVKGLQIHGHSACPKHFACNNQEKFRSTNDSRVSERALREIYLKGFEICVKEAKPRNIMTSYNKINGVWGHYHYELCQTILRGEWGYDGNIVTDWWMKPSQDPDFENNFNCGYRVRAGVDVLMPGGVTHFATHGDGSLLESYNQGGVTLAEIQRAAYHVLRFALEIEQK